MAIAASVLLLVMFTWYFEDLLDHQVNPNRDVVTHSNGSTREVQLVRNRADQYNAIGNINGKEVHFLVDTGASDVAISQQLADKLGIKKLAPTIASTANGDTQAWLARLESVSLGEIKIMDVAAIILPKQLDNKALLGMTFLKELELIHRDGILTLRQAL